MSLNWNFQRGEGFKPKNTLCGGSVDIFWNNTSLSCFLGGGDWRIVVDKILTINFGFMVSRLGLK